MKTLRKIQSRMKVRMIYVYKLMHANYSKELIKQKIKEKYGVSENTAQRLIRRAYLLLNEEFLVSALAAIRAVERTPAELVLSNSLSARLEREFHPKPIKHKPRILPDIGDVQEIPVTYPTITGQDDI